MKNEMRYRIRTNGEEWQLQKLIGFFEDEDSNWSLVHRYESEAKLRIAFRNYVRDAKKQAIYNALPWTVLDES